MPYMEMEYMHSLIDASKSWGKAQSILYYISYIIQNVFSCLHPTAVSDIERDEGGVVAIGTEVVDTLV